MPDQLEKEAEIFSRYLVKASADPQLKALYARAVMRFAPEISPRDKKIMQFIHRHPYFLGLVDSALAFSDPHSELRRRLYLMFAILEASPVHCGRFLPVKRSPFYLLAIAWTGTCAVCKALAGIILLKTII